MELSSNERKKSVMKLTKKQKKHLYKIIGAGVCFAGGIAAKAFTGLDFGAFKPLMLIPAALFAAAYLLVGLEVLIKAVKGIFHGELLDENFLMAIATVGAIALGDLSEGVAVMLFYQIGELFQSYAVGKSRRSITALMDIRPDYANIEQDGKLVQAAGGITEDVTQSDKLGYDWRNIYVNKILVRQEYVEQAVKAGTADNPIVWASDMALIQNAYYTHNGVIKVWMGEAGATAKWTDAAFVPI